MNIDDIKNIAVIGAGNMGHQIAMLCAIHGYKTVCTDINDETSRSGPGPPCFGRNQGNLHGAM